MVFEEFLIKQRVWSSPSPCTHQSVCIQEDTLAIMGEGPTVKFGQGDSKLGSPQKGQVDVVCTLYQVHLDYLIKHLREDNPAKDICPTRTGEHSTENAPPLQEDTPFLLMEYGSKSPLCSL